MAGFPGISPLILFVARHGETDWNAEGRLQGHTDVPLNARGREQAVALGAALAGGGIGAIVTSDLARARETGEIVARALGVGVPKLDLRWRERGFGVFEGRTKAELAASDPEAWRIWTEDPRARPPGGESHEDLTARVLAAATDAASLARPGAPALVVSHGAAVHAFLLAATGLRAPPLGNGTVYRLGFDGHGFDDLRLVWSGDADPPIYATFPREAK